MTLRTVLTIAAIAGSLKAQTFHRQAAIVGGGDRDRGRCLVEIVVDGVAEIAIRGDDATVNNLKGQAPELRRFECSSPLPPNPADLRFAATAGRGRQQLLRSATDGQPAVVHIEDPQNGSDRYAFELTWRGGGPIDADRGRPGVNPTAVENCKRAVEERARHDGYDRVEFGEVRTDDRPGRNEWLLGDVRAFGRRGPEAMRFSCSVDMRGGDVRSVDVVPVR